MLRPEFERSYNFRLNAVCIALLVLMAYRFVQSALVSGMAQPLLTEGSNDFLYGLFYSTGFPRLLLANNWLASLFDLLLFLLPVLIVATSNRALLMLLSLWLVIYILTFNWVTHHNYHGLVGAVVITLPFWSKKEERFNFLWDAARYYWLYVFVSAALWKILRGSAFHNNQLSNILMAQQLDYLLQHPDTWRAHVLQYLIANPSVSHIILLVNVLLQLSFLLGFFTRRFDYWLIALSVVFVAANFFVMNIVSAELLVLNLTLINWPQVEKRFGETTT